MIPLILASASRVRAALLQRAGVAFVVEPSHVDEDAEKQWLQKDGATPGEVARALAELKAQRVSAGCPDALVIGADQVLDLDGALLSKATNLQEARDQLIRLRGRSHDLICAAVLAKAGTTVWRSFQSCRLWMRSFSDAFLDGYLATDGDLALQSVGCYRLEERGVQLFERIEGDYFSILGLPLIPLLAALREQGALSK